MPELTSMALWLTSWRASAARGRKTHPVDDVVEARLQQLEELLAGGTGAARRLLVIAAELALEHTVHAPQLLLLTQLQAVVGQPLAALALDAAGRHLKLALGLKRLGTALEKQIRALAASELAGRTEISRHKFLP